MRNVGVKPSLRLPCLVGSRWVLKHVAPSAGLCIHPRLDCIDVSVWLFGWLRAQRSETQSHIPHCWRRREPWWWSRTWFSPWQRPPHSVLPPVNLSVLVEIFLIGEKSQPSQHFRSIGLLFCRTHWTFCSLGSCWWRFSRKTEHVVHINFIRSYVRIVRFLQLSLKIGINLSTQPCTYIVKYSIIHSKKTVKYSVYCDTVQLCLQY